MGRQAGDAATAHRSECRSGGFDAVRGRGGAAAVRSTAAAAAAVLACASLVGLAVLLSPHGAQAAVLKGATTFVWSTNGVGGVTPPTSVLHSAQRPSKARTLPKKGAGSVGTWGRLAAGFDISKTLNEAFERGERGSSALIHIDLPIQQYQANMRAYNVDGTQLPTYLRLNKVEAETLKEEKEDPGGVTRLKAMDKHLARRVDKVLVSIGKKLSLAEKWRQAHHVPNALSELQAIHVSKIDDAKWAKTMQDLDDVIAAHGGVPPPEDDSLKRARRAQTMEEQLVYDQALKRAFGKQPTLPVP